MYFYLIKVMSHFWSNNEINKLIKESNISYRLKCYAKKHKRSYASVSAKFYKIRTKNGLHWTSKDVNKLMNFKNNGYSYQYIAKKLKRSIGSVSAKYKSQKAINKIVKQETIIHSNSILKSLLMPIKIEK